MLLGRWGAFLVLFLLAWLISERASSKPWPPLTLLLVAVFASIGTTLPSSSNPLISTIKWGIFLCFLLFCGVVSNRVNAAQDVTILIVPLSWIFIAYIWFFPPSVFLLHSTSERLPGLFQRLFEIHQPRSANSWCSAVCRSSCIGSIWPAHSANSYSSPPPWVSGVWKSWRGDLAPPAADMIMMIGLALLRWKTPGSGMANRARLACIVLLVLVAVGQTDRVRRFFYKYPDASNLFESRQSYWEATNQSFRARRWMGTGFGVQTQQAESSLSFSTTGAFREQGSFFYGIREEVGYIRRRANHCRPPPARRTQRFFTSAFAGSRQAHVCPLSERRHALRHLRELPALSRQCRFSSVFLLPLHERALDVPGSSSTDLATTTPTLGQHMATQPTIQAATSGNRSLITHVRYRRIRPAGGAGIAGSTRRAPRSARHGARLGPPGAG